MCSRDGELDLAVNQVLRLRRFESSHTDVGTRVGTKSRKKQGGCGKRLIGSAIVAGTILIAILSKRLRRYTRLV